jgi:outer membrane protein OmpA-like peptidoglycan-associated protein
LLTVVPNAQKKSVHETASKSLVGANNARDMGSFASRPPCSRGVRRRHHLPGHLGHRHRQREAASSSSSSGGREARRDERGPRRDQKIKFAYNDDKILAESHSLLDEIADVIKKNPQVKKIEIGGHASSEGDDSKNMDLSKRRANSVMQYLTGKGGVGADHLVAKGFGETKRLVTPDDTEDKRETNRRVEFLVLELGAAPEAKK